jgi:hypothetical protein
MGPRTGLEVVEKSLAPPVLELRPLGHPTLSQSLYRLSYRGYVDRSGSGINTVLNESVL